MAAPPPSHTPSRKDLRRRAIVAAARKAFLRHGYGHTTMSSIAAALGGSKTTLWSYFPGKQDLFAAVVDDLVDRYGAGLRMPLPRDGDPAEVLAKLATLMLEAITRPQIIALHRMVLGEAGRFPELGQMLIERGMKRGQAHIAEWLTVLMSKGLLRLADPLIAAQHFGALCQSGVYQLHLFGACPRPGPARLREDATRAVQAFLLAYAHEPEVSC